MENETYKRLYEPNETMVNADGVGLISKLNKALRPIIDEYMENGYSAIEFESLLADVVAELMSGPRLRRTRMEMWKNRNRHERGDHSDYEDIFQIGD